MTDTIAPHGARFAALQKPAENLAGNPSLRDGPRVLDRDRPRKIETIAIPTRSRPLQLQRLLIDLVAYLHDVGRAPEIVVGDDSTETDARATRRVASELTERGLAVRYTDRKLRLAYAQRLAEEGGIPLRIARFALLGDTAYPFAAGACRNALLLDALGKSAALFMDDDVRCRVVKIPGSRDRIAFVPRYGGRFLRDYDAVESYSPIDEDLATIHERVLNIDENVIQRTISDGEADVRPVPNALLARLGTGNVRVRASLMGLIGDAGITDPLHYYIHGMSTFSKLTESEELYRAATVNRLILRGPTDLLVTEQAECMAYCMGVDLTDAVPLFTPAMRAEECLFGVLLSRCMPEALFGVAPRAILHSPIPQRSFEPGSAARRVGRLMAGEMISGLVANVSTPSMPESFVAVGKRLGEVLKLSDDEYRDTLKRIVTAVVVPHMQRLEQLLGDLQPTSIGWSDVLEIRDACAHRLAESDFSVPLEFESVENRTEARRRFRELLCDVSETVGAWPQMLETARCLHGHGVRPSVPAE